MRATLFKAQLIQLCVKRQQHASANTEGFLSRNFVVCRQVDLSNNIEYARPGGSRFIFLYGSGAMITARGKSTAGCVPSAAGANPRRGDAE